MSSETEHARSTLESKVAEKYRQQGFEVIVEPQAPDLPFDLGTYRPDLVVKRAPDENYIIEIKSSVRRMPIDRYREIAEIVSQHAGWSFLLVTGEDISTEERKAEDGLLSWEQMQQRETRAEQLLLSGEAEGAFLSLWGVLEAALRRRAIGALIPIERLPTSSLINHLYSQGELSIKQFDNARMLQSIRNRVVHGYQILDLNEPAEQLQKLVKELLDSWA